MSQQTKRRSIFSRGGRQRSAVELTAQGLKVLKAHKLPGAQSLITLTPSLRLGGKASGQTLTKLVPFSPAEAGH